jgi:ketosteroid isomerase-like protein
VLASTGMGAHRTTPSAAVTRATVEERLAVYEKAWERRDADLILTIFTDDAVYHERVLEAPARGHAGIRAYWTTRVVNGQANIAFRLLNLYVDGATAIAEWEASFDDLVQGVRKRIREVAILEFRGNLICSLREYWASEELGRIRNPGA